MNIVGKVIVFFSTVFISYTLLLFFKFFCYHYYIHKEAISIKFNTILYFLSFDLFLLENMQDERLNKGVQNKKKNP